MNIGLTVVMKTFWYQYSIIVFTQQDLLYKYYYITLSYFIIRGNISMTIWRVVRKQVNMIYIFTYIKFLCLDWIVFFLFKFEITHKLIITQWSELVNSRKINVVLTMFTKCLLWFEHWIDIGLWLVNLLHDVIVLFIYILSGNFSFPEVQLYAVIQTM